MFGFFSFLGPTILIFENKSPKSQLHFSHSNVLIKTCSFAWISNVRKLCVPGEWKAFRLPLKNARKAWRMCVFPMGHICTFVPNGKSLYVCFSVLWNEALVVIKLILSSLWQLILFLWEMKATANMFWINSITLKKKCFQRLFRDLLLMPCSQGSQCVRTEEKTNQGSFCADDAQCCNHIWG